MYSKFCNSIGSLGKDNSTAIVTKVVLDTAFLRETTNGLRIKTWQVGSTAAQSETLILTLQMYLDNENDIAPFFLPFLSWAVLAIYREVQALSAVYVFKM